MIDFLLGVPGKLKTISDYLTTNLAAVRAAKIDNLDAAISTRAAASTALSNATWTNARAAKLDSISATGVIKSIQTGFVSDLPTTSTGEDERYVNVTITAVTTSKSVVLIDGSRVVSSGTGGFSANLTARLIDSTTLRVASFYMGATTVEFGARWTVVEFN